MIFGELKGKTLTRYELIDWSLTKGFPSNIKVEDIIKGALSAGANITGLNKEKYRIYQVERKDEDLIPQVKFTKKELTELCRKHGTGGRIVLERIAAELGDKATNIKQIQNAIHNWKIKELLAKDSENKEELKEVEIVDQDVKAEDEPVAEQVPATEDKPKKRLKISALKGEHYYFDLEESSVEITTEDSKFSFPVPYGEALSSLIDNLIEIRDNYLDA